MLLLSSMSSCEQQILAAILPDTPGKSSGNVMIHSVSPARFAHHLIDACVLLFTITGWNCGKNVGRLVKLEVFPEPNSRCKLRPRAQGLHVFGEGIVELPCCD